jgi:hypothetical protein
MLSLKMVNGANGSNVTRHNVEDNISSARMRSIPKKESEALLKKILDEKRIEISAQK